MTIDERVRHLLTELEECSEPLRNISLLDELSFHYRRSDPRRGVEIARAELRLARSLGSDHWITRSMARLGDCHISLSEFRPALRYLTRARTLLDERQDNPAERAYVYRNIGSIYERFGDTEKAIVMFERSLAFARESGDEREIVASIGCLGQFHASLGAFVVAMELLQESLRIQERRGFVNGVAVAIVRIAQLHMMLEDLDLADAGFERSLGLLRQIGDLMGEATALGMLGEIRLRRGDHPRAIEYQMAAIAIYRGLGAREGEANIMTQLARSYAAFGVLEVALGHGHAALHVSEEIGNRREEAGALACLGEIYHGMGDRRSAAAMLNRSLDIMATMREWQAETSVHRLLAEVYEAAGEAAASLRHYKEFLRLRSESLGQETRRRLAWLQIRADVERAELEHRAGREKSVVLEQEVQEKARELTLMTLHLVQNSEFLLHIKRRVVPLAAGDEPKAALARAIIRDIDGSRLQADSWGAFERQFRQLDQRFLHNLAELRPALTPTELKICSMIRMSLSNKEIATLLSVSARTVDTHRTHIRRKLGLRKDDNLTTSLATI